MKFQILRQQTITVASTTIIVETQGSTRIQLRTLSRLLTWA